MPDVENVIKEDLVDIGEKEGAEIDLGKKKEERSKMKKVLRTVISPMTHLRNWMSQWMFEIARTIKNQYKRNRKK